MSPAGQQQFLAIKSREEAIALFRAALDPAPRAYETVPLAALLGRVLARDLAANQDVPPFDRSVVDGFAVRAADLAAASAGAPVSLRLNPESIACGHAPKITLSPGTASEIATGGPLPRGADAVLMIEHSEPGPEGTILARRAVAPGQNIAYAASDIASGQIVLYRDTLITSREIGLIAATGAAAAPVWKKPRVVVISTGDELVAPGSALGPAQIFDSNGPIIAAALRENGCEPEHLGAIRDEEPALRAAMASAFARADVLILSGGTSKGAGDLTYRLIDELGAPGILVHGVALKPGKPLCLAVCAGKPVIVLPGFPTSAMFTFHDIVAPVLREMAGLPARSSAQVMARVPQRVVSELGRTEFVMVALGADETGPLAHPIGKGSGAVTAFSQADGFFAVPALAEAQPANAMVTVELFAPHIAPPDFVLIGSHCLGLDAVIGVLRDAGFSTRVLATGSLGGLACLRRGECDLAPIHLLDPQTQTYNRPFLAPDQQLIPGWRRKQGLVFRADDPRFAGKSLEQALQTALADEACVMVNRNSGAGTRLLIDGLIGAARPPGYWNQPRSHHAVAASIAQGRADWGLAIAPVAKALGLGFLPIADELYDFAAPTAPRHPERLDAFIRAIQEAGPALRALGFEPAPA